MSVQIYNLWEITPGMCEKIPKITYYVPKNKTYDIAVVIFAGGGYDHRANHEGYGYAEFLSGNGISAFVVDYRVYPHQFPLHLFSQVRSVIITKMLKNSFLSMKLYGI